MVARDTALIKNVFSLIAKLIMREMKLIVAIRMNIFGKTCLKKDDVSFSLTCLNREGATIKDWKIIIPTIMPDDISGICANVLKQILPGFIFLTSGKLRAKNHFGFVLRYITVIQCSSYYEA